MLISDLAVLLKSNISVITALSLLSKEYPIVINIKQDIIQGESLSQALKKYPKLFDELTLQLIYAGERAAMLPLVLENIANYQEKSRQLKMRFKKALFYPMTVLIMAMLITVGLLIFIVPQFESLFQNMGAALPWFTRVILFISNFIQNYFIVLILLIIILISLFYYFRYNLPIIGKIYQKIMLSKFAYALAVLISSGMSVIEALKISAKLYRHEKIILKTREDIIQGKSLSSALESTKAFPDMFIRLIQIGEQSGSLKNMLYKIAEQYESETDLSLNKLTLMLEPAIMSILGLLIGGLVIALYLPVFELGKVIS